jgi:hypothetical protein
MFGGSGTNIKMFDYMAAGLPVVTTAIGARGIISLRDRAFLVTAQKRFSSTLRGLLRNRSLAATIARNARNLACDFYSWECISPSLGRLLAHRRSQFAVPPPAVSLIAITSHGPNQVDGLRKSLSALGAGVELIVIDQSPQPWAEFRAAPSLRFLYVHTELQKVAAVNLGALLAQGEILVFHADPFQPDRRWLDRICSAFSSPEVTMLAKSESPEDLEIRELVIRQESLHSTGGFLPGLRRNRVRLEVQWEARNSESRTVFVQTPPRGEPVDVAEWVGCSPREFVERAAARIVGGRADPIAIVSLTSRLESGKCDKIEALEEMLHMRVSAGLSSGELVPLLPDVFKDESTYLFSLEELLKFEDQAFVENTYRQLLRRFPEAGALSGNLHALREGTVSREDIIRFILDSSEARSVGVRVIGVNADVPFISDPGTVLLDESAE